MSYHPDDIRAFSALKRTVDRRLIERAVQKSAGNYAQADAIRKELEEDGWTIQDEKNGVTISVQGTTLRWSLITDLKTLVENATWHESN